MRNLTSIELTSYAMGEDVRKELRRRLDLAERVEEVAHNVLDEVCTKVCGCDGNHKELCGLTNYESDDHRAEVATRWVARILEQTQPVAPAQAGGQAKAPKRLDDSIRAEDTPPADPTMLGTLWFAASIKEPGLFYLMQNDGDELTCIPARTKEEWQDIADLLSLPAEFEEVHHDTD